MGYFRIGQTVNHEILSHLPIGDVRSTTFCGLPVMHPFMCQERERAENRREGMLHLRIILRATFNPLFGWWKSIAQRTKNYPYTTTSEFCPPNHWLWSFHWSPVATYFDVYTSKPTEHISIIILVIFYSVFILIIHTMKLSLIVNHLPFQAFARNRI